MFFYIGWVNNFGQRYSPITFQVDWMSQQVSEYGHCVILVNVHGAFRLEINVKLVHLFWLVPALKFALNNFTVSVCQVVCGWIECCNSSDGKYLVSNILFVPVFEW